MKDFSLIEEAQKCFNKTILDVAYNQGYNDGINDEKQKHIVTEESEDYKGKDAASMIKKYEEKHVEQHMNCKNNESDDDLIVKIVTNGDMIRRIFPGGTEVRRIDNPEEIGFRPKGEGYTIWYRLEWWNGTYVLNKGD